MTIDEFDVPTCDYSSYVYITTDGDTSAATGYDKVLMTISMPTRRNTYDTTTSPLDEIMTFFDYITYEIMSKCVLKKIIDVRIGTN